MSHPYHICELYTKFQVSSSLYRSRDIVKLQRKPPKRGKMPLSVAPVLSKSFVSHPCHISQLHTKFQVSSSYPSRDILFTDRQTDTHTDQWLKLGI
jgi:hypothetical protein